MGKHEIGRAHPGRSINGPVSKLPTELGSGGAQVFGRVLKGKHEIGREH
ncbi:hypothetical protein ACIGB8_04910 [Promicromonospora sukumoe]